MKLFDRIGEEDEEVVIKESEVDSAESGSETRLGEEVEDKITSGNRSTTESSPGEGSSVDLPGMSSSGSGSTGSSSVDIQDIHEQNKEIISLLKDIRDDSGGGRTDELL